MFESNYHNDELPVGSEYATDRADENLPEASTTDPARILESDDYEVYKNVPVFVEHTRTLKSGRELRFGRDELEALAKRSNRRIDETGDFAPVVVGHTSPDPAAPDPPKIGWAGPFRLGWLTKDHNKYAVLADFRIEKDKVPLLSKYPRRSAELWAEDRYEDMYLDPISLLGADTPWSDMGVLYSKNDDATREKIYYSIAPQAPGPYGTGLPQPVKITNDTTKSGDKEKYSMEEDDFSADSAHLSQDQKRIAQTIISAIFESPEFDYLRKLMGKEVADSVKPSEENDEASKSDSYLPEYPQVDDEDEGDDENLKKSDIYNKSIQNTNESVDDSSSDSDDSSDDDEGFDEEEEYLRRKYFGTGDDDDDEEEEDDDEYTGSPKNPLFRSRKSDDEEDSKDEDESDSDSNANDEDDEDRKSLYRKRTSEKRRAVRRRPRPALYVKEESSVEEEEPAEVDRRDSDREGYKEMTKPTRDKIPFADNEAEEKARYAENAELEGDEEEEEEETSGINKDDYPDDYGKEYREFEERARRMAELDRARQAEFEARESEQYEEAADETAEAVDYEKDEEPDKNEEEEDEESKFFKTGPDTNEVETPSADDQKDDEEEEEDTELDDEKEEELAKARYSRARERLMARRRRQLRYSRASDVHEQPAPDTSALEKKLASLESKLSRIERAFEWTTDKVVTAERYSKLHDLRASFIFDEKAEREKCRYSKMSDSQFEEHCKEIQNNYRQVPTNIDVPSWLVQNAPEYEDRPGAVQYSKEKSQDVERRVAELAESYASQGIYKPSEEIRNEVAKKMRQGR